MRITYNEITAMSQHGRFEHGWITYPAQLCAKTLLEQGMSGRLEVYPNENEDGDGLPDLVYPSIANTANSTNARRLTKGIDYAAWYPIAQKNRTWNQIK
jgi:hypothetical protein